MKMIKTLSKEERDFISREARKELSKRFYRDYLVMVHHGHYKILRHTDLVVQYLQRIADGEQLNLLIEMPPRHSKSMTVTETFPSFFLSKNPDKKVITAAYSDGLAKKFGRLNRNKFSEFSHLFGLGLADDSKSNTQWSINGKLGQMIATGIGGSITGEGADLMIIDDPIKNSKEARSKTIRDNIWAEWEATLSTRLQDNASLIIIQTRWHEDDLTGRMLSQSPRDFIRLRLPAIAEDEDDLLGREIGEPLAPELGYDEEWALQKEMEVGSKVWSSLYQQRPAPESGDIIQREWFNYYTVLPARLDRIVISWDMTFKSGKDKDYAVGQAWGIKGADKYLIDEIRGQFGFTQTLQAFKTFKAKHHEASAILVEDKANGPAIIDTLKREISGIIPVEPNGDKVQRLEAASPQIEAGNVYLPENAEFTKDYIEEMVAFPNAKHDDRVDATSQLLNWVERKPVAYASSQNIW